MLLAICSIPNGGRTSPKTTRVEVPAMTAPGTPEAPLIVRNAMSPVAPMEKPATIKLRTLGTDFGEDSESATRVTTIYSTARPKLAEEGYDVLRDLRKTGV